MAEYDLIIRNGTIVGWDGRHTRLQRRCGDQTGQDRHD